MNNNMIQEHIANEATWLIKNIVSEIITKYRGWTADMYDLIAGNEMCKLCW